MVSVTTGVPLADTNGAGFANTGGALQTRDRSAQATDLTNFRSELTTMVS
jgi:hypothetical protein